MNFILLIYQRFRAGGMLIPHLHKVLYILFQLSFSLCFSQSDKDMLRPPLVLHNDSTLNGNPFPNYKEMLILEEKYVKFPPLTRVYWEQRYMAEEFMGLHQSGLEAMGLFKSGWNVDDTIPDFYNPVSAIQVIKEEATKTKIVIWAEEHHLQQTRSYYSLMIHELWKLGYRYLAAESFSPKIQSLSSNFLSYESGLYTRDPVFAFAVHEALLLGFKIIDYDPLELGGPADINFRDRKSAENILSKVFMKDSAAKLLIFAGRLHTAECTENGWEPLGAVLKRITNINPFTIYAPTMTERLKPEEEHPAYKQAITNFKIKEPTIFKNKKDGSLYTLNGTFDAYVFFPRTTLINGRPNWLFTIQGRKKITLKLPISNEMILVQALPLQDKVGIVPIDQYLTKPGSKKVALALPQGKYLIRFIIGKGIIQSKNIKVE